MEQTEPKITVSEYEVDVLLSILYHWGTARNTAGKFQDYIQKKTLYKLFRGKGKRDTAAELKQLETEFREKIPALLELREQQARLMQQEIEVLKGDGKDKDAQIAKLEAERADKDAQIAKLEAERADKDAQTKAIIAAIHTEGEKTRRKIELKSKEDADGSTTQADFADVLMKQGYFQGIEDKDTFNLRDTGEAAHKKYLKRLKSICRNIRNWEENKHRPTWYIGYKFTLDKLSEMVQKAISAKQIHFRLVQSRK